jgi:hypothetical protein
MNGESIIFQSIKGTAEIQSTPAPVQYLHQHHSVTPQCGVTAQVLIVLIFSPTFVFALVLEVWNYYKDRCS